MSTFCADGREDFDLPPGTEEKNGSSHDPDADTRLLQLSPRRTRAEMLAHSIDFLCPNARFLARAVSSLITALGGVGKTRLLLQMLYELSLGQAPFGCELLRPPRPMVCLYIGAEDRERFFNQLALPLLTHDDDTLPFDHILLPEVWPDFTLTKSTARILATFLEGYRAEHGLDCVVLDPMLSLISRDYSDMIKNPVIARAFFNDCLAPLLRSQAFALVSANHDSKAGAAVTGSVDQQNAARCVLQLSTEERAADGTTSIAAERHKDNCGFRFSKLVLDRNPNTLLLTWNEAASVYAYGAPSGHATGPSTDPVDIMRYLCRQAARLLTPSLAPVEQRTKRAVEMRLSQQAARDGTQKTREYVRRCLDAYCAFEEGPRQGRSGRRLILVGVRNPDAPMDEHDDYIAGRAPTDGESPSCG